MDARDINQCTTLVPIDGAHEPRIASQHAARPDASFVAHLIATATGSPQTRTLRRATFTEALGGYNVASVIATAPRPANSNRVSRVA